MTVNIPRIAGDGYNNLKKISIGGGLMGDRILRSENIRIAVIKNPGIAARGLLISLYVKKFFLFITHFLFPDLFQLVNGADIERIFFQCQVIIFFSIRHVAGIKIKFTHGIIRVATIRV